MGSLARVWEGFRADIHSGHIPGAYITVGFGIQQINIYIIYIPKVCIRIRTSMIAGYNIC